MIAAINCLTFLALLAAVPSCAFLGLYLLWAAIFRPLECELERDRQVEYRHSVPAVPRRAAPQWIRALQCGSSRMGVRCA